LSLSARLRPIVARIAAQEYFNFLITNRIPRRRLTQFFGWFSKIEQPLVRELSIGVWRLFVDLDLSDARKSEFKSLHECFIRELKAGARPIDPDRSVLVSPCDAIVGASGTVAGTHVLQIKGSPYRLQDLLGDTDLEHLYRNGRYVTLRLKSSMYHRFHAPHDCRIEQVTHIPGDVWNVNPPALKRVERLFCRNERALIRARVEATGDPILLVAVAAILVSGIRLRFLDLLPGADRHERSVLGCDATLEKGQEMGWFEHGSTMIVFAPHRFALCDGVREGALVRVGQALMRIRSA
jgi:phosphatidylserine decarboxylase